jgi:hypothetical protein
MDGSMVLDWRERDGGLPGWESRSSQGQAKRTTRWTLHVRALGQTWCIPGESSGIDPRSADRILLAELARRLQLAPSALDDHAVDRADDLVMVRPWAIWG